MRANSAARRQKAPASTATELSLLQMLPVRRFASGEFPRGPQLRALVFRVRQNRVGRKAIAPAPGKDVFGTDAQALRLPTSADRFRATGR
jgi:hypothetical protein